MLFFKVALNLGKTLPAYCYMSSVTSSDISSPNELDARVKGAMS